MDTLCRQACGARCTVKPCGPVPPMQGTSLRDDLQATVAKKLVHRGDHGAAVKPLRRECRMISAYLCWPRVRLFLFCTQGSGCVVHPAFPAPSTFVRDEN